MSRSAGRFLRPRHGNTSPTLQIIIPPPFRPISISPLNVISNQIWRPILLAGERRLAGESRIWHGVTVASLCVEALEVLGDAFVHASVESVYGGRGRVV